MLHSTSYICFAEGEDFVQIMTMELEFTSTTFERCIDVEIENDAVVEGTEVFAVSVESNDPVTFETDSVTVSILDDQDSKLFLS